ncbi:MAG: hypothetical protein Q7J68_01130, partial [Thermoplasmata archaeon]|nr:hypothetical protein [Thermoplasmata archaeon]
MEKELRKKALVGLVALIVAFAAFCAYMFIVVPEKQAVYFTFLDSNEAVLDSLNYSELQQSFYEPAFLENYTVRPKTEGDEALDIIPKHNPDLVVSLLRDNEDIYLIAEVYITVGAFGGMGGRFSEIIPEFEEDIRAIARYMGHEEIAADFYWDDNDFTTFPNFILIFMFFGLMATVFTYSMIMTVRKGKVLEEFFNYRFTDNNLSVAFFIYLASGFCFLYIWYIAG